MAAIRTTIIIFLLILVQSTFGQSQLLEKRVNIDRDDAPIREVLSDISQQTGITFSYNTTVVNTDRKISIHVRQKRVHEVLIFALGDAYDFKVKGKYVVIKPIKKKPDEIIIRGYIDDASGKGISEATVYDPISLKSANTNAFGYYELLLTTEDAQDSLMVKKEDFTSRNLALRSDSLSYTHLSSISLAKDSIPLYHFTEVSKTIDHFSISLQAFFARRFPELENIKDTLYRDVQIGFVPMVGTNRRLSGQCINHFSFNVLGGYSFANNGFELAGLFNFNQSYCRGMQIGGLFNIAGENSQGFQIGGLFNHSGNEASGFRIGGLFNSSHTFQRGMQLAGLVNFNHISTGSFDLAGLTNICVDTCASVQMAGLVNYAQLGRTQIAPFNFADTLTGVPIGFFSYVKKGYHKLELSYDHEDFAQIQFRTGVHQLYNIFQAGYQLHFNEPNEYSVGYGLGTSPRLSERLSLNIDLLSQYYLSEPTIETLNMRAKGYLGLEYQLWKRLSLFAQSSIGYMINDDGFSPSPEFGWKAGIRFF